MNKHDFPIGTCVLVDGHFKAIVRAYYSDGSQAFRGPYYKVDFSAGVQGVLVDKNRVTEVQSISEEAISRLLAAEVNFLTSFDWVPVVTQEGPDGVLIQFQNPETGDGVMSLDNAVRRQKLYEAM